MKAYQVDLIYLKQNTFLREMVNRYKGNGFGNNPFCLFFIILGQLLHAQVKTLLKKSQFHRFLLTVIMR